MVTCAVVATLEGTVYRALMVKRSGWCVPLLCLQILLGAILFFVLLFFLINDSFLAFVTSSSLSVVGTKQSSYLFRLFQKTDGKTVRPQAGSTAALGQSYRWKRTEASVVHGTQTASRCGDPRGLCTPCSSALLPSWPWGCLQHRVGGGGVLQNDSD